MTRRAKLYLKDIIDAIENIESYTKNVTFARFSHNKMVQDAVIRNIEIIGEAAKHLPADIKSPHKEIPWQEIQGMRNKVIHEYFGVDLDIVWKTIRQSLPILQKSLKKAFKNL
ncbi:MAG: DUF86 domain-containing protein [Candidatus Omnitrophota bacterium]|nr:DUF86 domain-containing protein [Candidatus Omnitrophota bacterium]